MKEKEKNLYDKIFLCYACTDDPVIQDWLTEALQMIDPEFPHKEYPDKVYRE